MTLSNKSPIALALGVVAKVDAVVGRPSRQSTRAFGEAAEGVELVLFLPLARRLGSRSRLPGRRLSIVVWHVNNARKVAEIWQLRRSVFHERFQQPPKPKFHEDERSTYEVPHEIQARQSGFVAKHRVFISDRALKSYESPIARQEAFRPQSTRPDFLAEKVLWQVPFARKSRCGCQIASKRDPLSRPIPTPSRCEESEGDGRTTIRMRMRRRCRAGGRA